MTEVLEKIMIEEATYREFKKSFGNGNFGRQRFGQAFFDYFKLDRLKNKEQFDKLYNEPSTSVAVSMIRSLFHFN